MNPPDVRLERRRPGNEVPDHRGRVGLDRTGRTLDRNRSVRIVDVELVASGWHVLRATTFDFQHADGRWSRERRETYDRGNGATILLYDTERATVLLSRQFRYPVYVNDHPAGYTDIANAFVNVATSVYQGDPRPAAAARRAFLTDAGLTSGPPPCIPAAPPPAPPPPPPAARPRRHPRSRCRTSAATCPGRRIPRSRPWA